MELLGNNPEKREWRDVVSWKVAEWILNRLQSTSNTPMFTEPVPYKKYAPTSVDEEFERLYRPASDLEIVVDEDGWLRRDE